MSSIRFEVQLNATDVHLDRLISLLQSMKSDAAKSKPAKVEEPEDEAEEEKPAKKPVRKPAAKSKPAKVEEPEEDEEEEAEKPAKKAAKKDDGISLNQLRAKTSELVDENRAAIKKKLTQFGANNVSSLSEEHFAAYWEFLTGLE